MICPIDKEEVQGKCECGCIKANECKAHWSRFEKKEFQTMLDEY